MNFSQRDPLWAHEALGFSELTIGRAGCLLTCMASMLAGWGVDTDPGRLNAALRANGGFVNGNLLVYSAVAPWGARLVAAINCEAVPAPVAYMQEALASGQAVLATVDWRPGGIVQTHWVRVLALGEHDGQIMDPWQLPGREVVSLSRYLAPDWDPARGIFRVVIYRRADPLVAPPAPRTGGDPLPEHQPQVYARPVEPSEE